MGSQDGEMREDKRKGRNWEEGWKVSRKARQSEKCVFVQARAFEWVQDKVGDYGRSEETLWHPTRCPAPLSLPPPSLPCQHEHPVHTQGSCRNYGPLCFEDTLTECTNTWCIISKRSQSVQSVLFVGDCQQWLLNFSIYQGLPVLEHRFSGGSMAFKRTSSGVDMMALTLTQKDNCGRKQFISTAETIITFVLDCQTYKNRNLASWQIVVCSSLGQLTIVIW